MNKTEQVFIRNLKIVALLVLIASCKPKPSEYKISSADSIAIEYKAKQRTADIIKDSEDRVYNDMKTDSKANSPVSVISSKVIRGRYGSDELRITVKNRSSKTVDGIKLRYRLSNNFGDKINESGGIAQEILKGGKTDIYTFNIYGEAATKADAFIMSVHFKDGSTWETK